MSKKIRINLRLDAELYVWAREYAHRHGSTVTQLVTMVLGSIRELDEQHQAALAEAPQLGEKQWLD